MKSSYNVLKSGTLNYESDPKSASSLCIFLHIRYTVSFQSTSHPSSIIDYSPINPPEHHTHLITLVHVLHNSINSLVISITLIFPQYNLFLIQSYLYSLLSISTSTSQLPIICQICYSIGQHSSTKEAQLPSTSPVSYSNKEHLKHFSTSAVIP